MLTIVLSLTPVASIFCADEAADADTHHSAKMARCFHAAGQQAPLAVPLLTFIGKAGTVCSKHAHHLSLHCKLSAPMPGCLTASHAPERYWNPWLVACRPWLQALMKGLCMREYRRSEPQIA
eukprot:4336416-Pleurochrysis_carterae.AAC.1